ncbi:MAG: hypothetical protein JJE39_07255 [Vicinamibacteria bacterium]|nr:hypothetical protein [Vicinamibacteria bacterium]
MTDGSVFVGGRREILRGLLDRAEMQGVATRLDMILKSLGPAGPPSTLSLGDGPALFRFSVLIGARLQTVLTGSLPPESAPALEPLPEFIRSLASFRHPSLRPFDPPQFAMIVREKTLSGGCRPPGALLPPLAQSIANEVVVSEKVTRGLPTGAEMAQICDGEKRYAVVFRPLIPGER